MRAVARGFYVVSVAIAVLLIAGALVSLALGDDQFTLLSALLLWIGTGLPLVVAGLVLEAFRRRRGSMRMPSHLPDWARDQDGR